MQNNAAEIVLRAERKAGEMLATMEKGVGGRPGKTGNTTLPVSQKPSDLGVEKMQSSRWQAIARVSGEQFETYLADKRAEGEEITTAGLL
jgi:hypothetical protein